MSLKKIEVSIKKIYKITHWLCELDLIYMTNFYWFLYNYLRHVSKENLLSNPKWWLPT